MKNFLAQRYRVLSDMDASRESSLVGVWSSVDRRSPGRLVGQGSVNFKASNDAKLAKLPDIIIQPPTIIQILCGMEAVEILQPPSIR